MEIVEGNKLIKTFAVGDEHLRGQFGRILSPHEYKYHYSWNWLMPVWKKFSELTRIGSYYTHYHRIKDFISIVDIEKTHKALAEAIQWYYGEENFYKK